MDKMEKRLEVQGEVLAAARDEAEYARGRAIALAIEAADAGYSQHHIAELLGIDRMTVRKWLGKK